VTGIPLKAEVWFAQPDLLPKGRYRHFDNLQTFQEYLYKKYGWRQPSGRGVIAGAPQYDKSQAAEEISQQNRKIREYPYHYTPPEELSAAQEQ
jgi:hypothetical protein